MATATILHLGDDVCYRIPLMEQAGLVPVRTECSVVALQMALKNGADYAGIAFHNEAASRLSTVAETARNLSTAPLILFRNSWADCDESLFDLVVPVQTPPDLWLKYLRQTIEEARKIRKASERLREECAEVRLASQMLQRVSSRNRQSPIDPDALWHDKTK